MSNSTEHNIGIQQTPDKLDELVQMRKDGYTLDEIGTRLGISGERVRQIARTLEPDYKTLHALSKAFDVGLGKMQRILDEHEIRPEGYRGRQSRAVYSEAKVRSALSGVNVTSWKGRKRKNEDDDDGAPRELVGTASE